MAESRDPEDGSWETTELAADLRRQISLGHAVLVTGAGVAAAASGNDPTATWRGLIESGIGWAEGRLPAQPGSWGSYARGLVELGLHGDTPLLLHVAEMITEKLGGRDGPEYRAWLHSTVGALPLVDPTVPKALAALNLPIVTTNYDDLIERAIGWGTTTWTDPYSVQRAFRESEPTVVHLHGHWKTPSSVVLGVRAYADVLGDSKAQALQHIIAANKALVFVGVGAGADDPNFSALRNWLATTFPGSEYRHFRLCLQQEAADLVAEFRGERIVPVVYGTNHRDLVEFLHELAPAQKGKSSYPEIPATGRLSNLRAEPFANEFVGRASLLSQMREALDQPVPPDRPHALALRGAMGVGKSRTAKEYARRNAADYKIIWWISAEHRAGAQQAITQLGTSLGLPMVEDLERACEAVGSKLRALGRFLLIFDNVEDINDVLPYFPVHDSGHIIVTTRIGTGQFGTDLPVLPVPPLPAEDAIRLVAPEGLTVSHSSLRALCDELGHLPLALVWSRAALAQGSTPRQILAEIRGHAPTSRQHAIDDSAPLVSWSLAIEALRDGSQDAFDLLALCAFLGPGITSDALIADPSIRPALPENLRAISRHGERLRSLQMRIGSVGLGDYQDGKLEVHRVTQHFIRSHMSEAQRQYWDEIATGLLLAAFPAHPHSSSDSARCERYLEHALAVGSCKLSATTPSMRKAALLNRCGNYLFSRAMYSQSAAVFQRTAAIVRYLLGGSGELYAVTLSNLGLSRLNEGKAGAALRLCEYAHGLRAQSAADQLALAASHNNLGCVSRELGDLETAARHFERAREIYARHQETDPASFAMAVNNLGVVRAQLRQPDAFPLLEQALQAERQARGERHIEVAITMNNLSIAHRASGDFDGSEKILRDALEIVIGLWSDEHPDTAGILNNLGVTLRSQGRAGEALGYIEKALAIEQAYYGASHPEVASTLNNLGVTLRHMGRYAAALLAQERALLIYEQAYQTEDHLRIAATHGGLGNMLRRLGDLDAAVFHHSAALEIESKLYPPGDLELAGTHDNLGRALRHLGQLDEAARHFEQALVIKRAHLEPDDADVAKSLDNLGVTRRFQGRFEEAATLHADAIEIRRRAGDRKGLLYSLISYAFAARHNGSEESASRALEEAATLEALP